MIHSWATEEEDDRPSEIRPVGKQRIEDTGPLTKKRMETIDDEVSDVAEAFIRQAVADGKPFFVWWNTTRMHIWTHLAPEAQGVTGVGIYPDGMVEHDADVGRMLDLLDELGVTDNTIVMYSTDNGAEEMTWPDGGTTPFRGEKNTTFDGGFRVPCLWRWPGVIAPGTISNAIGAHEDCLPTLLAAAGQPDITQQLLDGLEVGDRTYKVHIDGYNFMPNWSGEDEAGPRREFFYWTDDGDLAALRYNNWKIHFLEQRAEGLDVWQEPFVALRFPKLMNLRSDPFEDADIHSSLYPEWRMRHAYALVPAQAFVAGRWRPSRRSRRDSRRPASPSATHWRASPPPTPRWPRTGRSDRECSGAGTRSNRNVRERALPDVLPRRPLADTSLRLVGGDP